MAIKLTVKEVESITVSGKTLVSENLYLMIDRRHGGKSWVFRYTDPQGKRKEKGLGGYPTLSLKDARAFVAGYRKGLTQGIDPIQVKQDAKLAIKSELAKAKTFGDCARAYIDAHKSEWKNIKHLAQWESTLATYCADIMKMPIKRVDKESVLDILTPIWETKTETATRVRQRIEAVMDYALERGYCDGANPARWRGGLRTLLANPNKLKQVRHQPALGYQDIASFMGELEDQGAFTESGTLGVKSLAFIILTATRASEAVHADWSEFNFDAKTWTIPANRMKAGKEHRVPLSDKVLNLLATLKPIASGYIFPATRSQGKPKSIGIHAPWLACKAINPNITTHGFRSTFRDWTADNTAYPRDVAEQALAHTIKDKTESAYRRSDMLEKRARLMQDWAKYCFTYKPAGANVTPIGKAL